MKLGAAVLQEIHFHHYELEGDLGLLHIECLNFVVSTAEVLRSELHWLKVKYPPSAQTRKCM